MDTQKLTFDIQEIPEGQSHKTAQLPEDYFDLKDGARLIEADVSISFYRTDHFVKVSFEVNSKVELTCDRSLDTYIDTIEGSFDILFEPGEVEESETVKSAVRQIPSNELVLDIEEEVRDTIILNIPAKKIHPRYYDEEGKPEDFGVARFGDIEDPDEEQKIDPRWEELKKLKKK
ncbi:YceD family protein [Rhodohalobacter sp. 8-1]|uniref:YceD family protein n=1 Tax=Rhodohalobacter sp. 8-1 TaxID=3131972 RepID=UPI0030EF8118